MHHEEAEKPEGGNAGRDAKAGAPPLRKAAGRRPPKKTRKKKDARGDDERKVIGVEEGMAAATEAIDEEPLMDVEVGVDDDDRPRQHQRSGDS